MNFTRRRVFQSIVGFLGLAVAEQTKALSIIPVVAKNANEVEGAVRVQFITKYPLLGSKDTYQSDMARFSDSNSSHSQIESQFKTSKKLLSMQSNVGSREAKYEFLFDSLQSFYSYIEQTNSSGSEKFIEMHKAGYRRKTVFEFV